MKLLAVAFLVVLTVVLVPKVFALAEVAAGVALMVLGLLMLLWWLLPRGLWRRFDILALLLAAVALVEDRRQRP